MEQKDFARYLRKNMTEAEKKLWYYIKNKQFYSLKFRRQYIVGPYVVDFICIQLKLVIECDGSQHCKSESDRVRDKYLASKGYKVLRFWNHDVLKNINNVLEAIRVAAVAHPPPSSTDNSAMLN